jgi:hypothetical protein
MKKIDTHEWGNVIKFTKPIPKRKSAAIKAVLEAIRRKREKQMAKGFFKLL